MTLLDSVFKRLNDGHWVFDDLFTIYRNQLAQKLSGFSNDSICAQFSVAHYGQLTFDDSQIEFKNKGLSFLKLSSKVEALILEAFSSREEQISVGAFESGVFEKIKAAFKLIESCDQNLAATVKGNIELFIRIHGASFKGSSHPHFQGVMFIGDGVHLLSVEQMAVSLIHELAHQELFLVNLIDRLVNQEFDSHEIHAPMQGKSRPPIGRLHSLWALYRMVQFQRLLGIYNERHENLLIQNSYAFGEKELTEKGRSLIQIASEMVA